MLTAVEHRFREASALADSPASRVAAPSRGGLPPGLTRRIRDYIESHLDGNVRLETLASLAGLSVHHFARAFRQSIGLSPHKYVLRRRIERARELLSQTDPPLSEIALSIGFADHSHFARHFRRLTGMTPSTARWLQRRHHGHPSARRDTRLSERRHRQLLSTDPGVARGRDVCVWQQCGRTARGESRCDPVSECPSRRGGRRRGERQCPGRRIDRDGASSVV
jgi:AraC-like DNA-binding protein